VRAHARRPLAPLALWHSAQVRAGVRLPSGGQGATSVEFHDRGPFGANPGSVLVAQLRVRRQRTFSASRIRRTWLRWTLDAAGPGRLAQGVQRPLRRAALIVS
jgi:hypothetical protein